MYQAEALIEMNRVSQIGARVPITGKYDNYFDDDTAAFQAEIGTRAKKHPNYFTDVDKLLNHLDKFKFELKNQKYFLRRGDFTVNIAEARRPEMFYEYLPVLRKTAVSSNCEDLVISKNISKTCTRLSKIP